jgi:hypothetical protein
MTRPIQRAPDTVSQQRMDDPGVAKSSHLDTDDSAEIGLETAGVVRRSCA